MHLPFFLIVILFTVQCLQAWYDGHPDILKRNVNLVDPPAEVDDSNFFKCSDGRNIVEAYVCDHSFDCPFGEDEINCPNLPQYSCDGASKTIPEAWVCDVITDCPDGDDEENCTESIPSRYFCRDGSGVIPMYWVCDGYTDCVDNDDEEDCIEYPHLCGYSPGNLCGEEGTVPSGEE